MTEIVDILTKSFISHHIGKIVMLKYYYLNLRGMKKHDIKLAINY